MVLQIEEKSGGKRRSSEEKGTYIRILVVDDQRLFRECIAGMLAQEQFFSVVGQAGDGIEALELAETYKPDVLLMDVQMPRMDGIEALRRIKEEWPQIRVILLSAYTVDERVLEGLSAGASGYLLKDSSAEGVVAAIRAVYAGEQVITSRISRRMMQLYEQGLVEKEPIGEGLTSREIEVLLRIARGMVPKEIAQAIAVTEKTVRNHISNIYRKLNIYDRSQIVIYAIKKGLIDVQDV
ncbi:DNA-binding response regulator [Ktedonobacter sp. SOSP1-52]|uniref:response regulator transcription factor n=1 Tax=Ktedonobacter sp. SOSP1-52 TaxID=2778366 RepID=UPI001915D879|nr:response regulator transcription factor [Ktedonobacter sp. SOSP1-52]GHO66123.1 DNA-binding response regulator [Ktedonobacter sp. SOSP1-52]